MCKGTVVQVLASPDLFPLCSIETNHGIHPASYSVLLGALFLGVKGHEHEADHSCPSSAKFELSYTAIPPNAYVVCTDNSYTKE